jgi:SAM-dependent methyltransferase
MVQVKDWRLLLKDMHRVLRPGGILIFGEIYPQITAPHEQFPATEGPASRSAHFVEVYRAALSDGGVQIEAAQHVGDWLTPDNEIWASQPGSGFCDIMCRTWEMPVNGFLHPDPLMQRVGALLSLNFCEFIGSARPVILSQGFTDLELDQWAEDMRRETQDPMNNAVIRYHLVWASKL